MSEPMPTIPGDVLIVETTRTYTIYAIGRVSQHGQKDFSNDMNVKHETDHTAAVAEAKALGVQNGRIFLLNIDTDEWSQIPK